MSAVSRMSRDALIEQLRAQQKASAAKEDESRSNSEGCDDEGSEQSDLSQPSDGSHDTESSTGSG